MTKDEIKNRISMALKDPILQQGFEIICKENNELENIKVKIEELEKENKAKRIKDLEKENTELKEQLGNVQMQKAGEKSDFVWKLKTANEQKTEKLTKAKEIIKNLLFFLNKFYDEDCPVCMDEAEQFLKETDE